jgi:hypothetical protein
MRTPSNIPVFGIVMAFPIMGIAGTYVVVISYPEGDPPTVTVTLGGVKLKKDYVLPRRKRP